MRFTRASRPRVTSRVFQRTTIVYLRMGTEFSIFGGVYVSHVWGGVRASEVSRTYLRQEQKERQEQQEASARRHRRRILRAIRKVFCNGDGKKDLRVSGVIFV